MYIEEQISWWKMYTQCSSSSKQEHGRCHGSAKGSIDFADKLVGKALDSIGTDST